MAIGGRMTFFVLMVAPLCMAQIHPEQWTIPIVSDEHGNLCFGDLSEQNDSSRIAPSLTATAEQNDTTQTQSGADEPQLTDESRLSVDFSQELLVELPQNHISQPQAIRTLLTDEDIESLSADLYHPVYTFLHSDKDHQNIADHEANQQKVSSTLSQEPVAIATHIESADTDLGTLLDYGDLGPLSVDAIDIEPLSADSEMEILFSDTFQHRSSSMYCAKQRLNASELQRHMQVPTASFDSTNKKARSIDEQRDKTVTCSVPSGSACRQSVESVRSNSSESSVQSGFLKSQFINRTAPSGDDHRHRQTYAGEKPFQCDVCPKSFCTSSSFQKHRQIHTAEKLFKCDFCLKEFSDSSGYQKHRRIHTGEKPFKCELCQKMFSDPSSYRRHQRKHTGEKPFQCHICLKQFRYSDSYQKHRRIHTGEKLLKCDFCLKEFSDPSGYHKHRRIHTGEKPFKCEFCPKEFSDSSNYQVHRRTHTNEKPFKCNICLKQFCTSSNYKRHLKTHTAKKPIKCDLRTKQFLSFEEKKIHQREHTGEKRFKCDFCQKEFNDYSGYQRHRRTHTGESPFQCDICMKKFCASNNYQRHRRTHTGEKPFKCNFCQKKFSDRSNCKAHQRTHAD